ncbi:MAG: YqcC family protein [Pseudomonadota bacterium]
MDTLSHQLADLLLAIEAEMRRLGLWEQQPPPEEALCSLMPFCHDTLRLEQWLQWVFLPKMKRVLETGEEFPGSSEIEPLAEYRFNLLPQQTDRLLALIGRFDALINRTSREGMS